MITISGYNPASTGVAFGQKEGKPRLFNWGKSAKTATMQSGREVKQASGLARKVLVYLLALGTSAGAVRCTKDELPEIKKDAFTTEYTETMKNMYAMSEQEAAAGKFDTIALKTNRGIIDGVKSLGKQGDSTVVRYTSLDDNASKPVCSVIFKLFKKAGDAAGNLSGKWYLYNVNKKGAYVLKAAYPVNVINKDGQTLLQLSGKDYMKAKAKEIGKVVEQTFVFDGDPLKLIYTRLK